LVRLDRDDMEALIEVSRRFGIVIEADPPDGQGRRWGRRGGFGIRQSSAPECQRFHERCEKVAAMHGSSHQSRCVLRPNPTLFPHPTPSMPQQASKLQNGLAKAFGSYCRHAMIRSAAKVAHVRISAASKAYPHLSPGGAKNT